MHHGKITPQIAEGLKVLQERIGDQVPSSKVDETLNLATWNIRDFGKSPRTPAGLHYIAEILGMFDLVALVELRDNLNELETVMRYLGPYWRLVYNDYIADDQGNMERMGFLYDKRQVTFTGFAAEPEAPRVKNKVTGNIEAAGWWRTPYMAGFRSGDFDFVALSAHVRWGKTTAGRRLEVEMLANWLNERMKQTYAEDRDFILVGDFNIAKVTDPLYKKLQEHGWTIPPSTLVPTTKADSVAHFDQILHHTSFKDVFTPKGGVLEFAKGGWEPLFPKATYPNLDGDDYTWEISDHLPLWVHIDTDVDTEKLDQVISQGGTRRRVAVPVGG